MSAIPFLVLALATRLQSPVLVQGRVIDDATAPVEYALVEVTATNGKTISARTNTKGEYVLRGIDPADHVDLLIRRIGFKPVRITLTHTECDGILVANVQMVPLDWMVGL